MIPLTCFMLLLCLSASAENMYRESGEDLTLKCSSAGCLSSMEGYIGMYLYQEFKKLEEVLYYHSVPGSTDKITPRMRFENRIQTNGPLMNHTITISNLTVEDAGFYRCVYITDTYNRNQCDVYTLVVKGVPCAPATEETSPAVLIIVTCVTSTLVTIIFILLIFLGVKRWTSGRRTTQVRQASNDSVYEVMTWKGFQPPAAS